MKKSRLFLALVLLSACGHKESPPVRRTQVLFIGNSLTWSNDLPGTFAAVAQSLGNPVDILAHDPAGAVSTSKEAVENGDFLDQQLPSKKWDFVVLQEHSAIPAEPQDLVDQKITPYARQLAERIRANSPATRLVYLMTWGYKEGITDNCRLSPAFCSYASMQDRLQESYTALARANRGVLAPAGLAWRRIREGRPEINLYSDDDHHPSRDGTYLTACVVYDILFKKKSSGADAHGLEPIRASVLQDAADAVVFDPQYDWYLPEGGAPPQK